MLHADALAMAAEESSDWRGPCAEAPAQDAYANGYRARGGTILAAPAAASIQRA